MTKNMLVVFLAAVGCGNLTDPSSGSDDAAEQPDGGVEEPPVDPKVLSIVPTQWKDERLDTIDFSSGEPVHMHQGAGVTIAAGGACPAAYRYAYLMDRAPAFGREPTKNAMEIEVAVPTIALDAAASSYRVTTADSAAVIPWTPIGAVPESGRVRIALYRDDAAKLGTYTGELRFDVRVRDTAGVEQIASACWVNHPMAAPLAIEQAQSALGPAALAARQLAAPASRPIDVLVPTSAALPAVYSTRITQQTAEPVTVAFAPAAPTGTFTSTLAYAYFATGNATVPGNCEDYPESCDMSPLPAGTTTTASGALTSGTWSLTLVDEASGAKMPCSTTTCDLPGRAVGAAPAAYRLTVAGSNFSNLWHQPGTLAAVREVTVAGSQAIGVWLTANKVRRCSQTKTVHEITACIALLEYTSFAALDRATLAMPALAIEISTATKAITATPVPYLPNGAITTPAVNWNGGDGPL